MKPTVESLSEQFTRLIGPEAFAKAEAAIAAAKVAAEAAAKAAAEKAAAAAAAAKAAAVAAVTNPAPAKAGTTSAASPITSPSSPASPVVPPSGGIRLPAKAGTTNIAPAVAGAATPPAPKVAAPAAPLPTLPLQHTAHAAKGYDLDATVAPSQVVAAAELLDRSGFGLDTITGVDWIAQNEMEVVYDYFHPTAALRVVVRTRVPRANPEVPTITAIFPGANWHERETHDFFGIRFLGHPNLKPFLLPEDADFHPLRKDYQP